MRSLAPNEVLERIYSGWLGKLIGIRLGAPVEMWTSEQILEKFGLQEGYLMDYKEFAADDDSNGPSFFVRAMEDSGHYRDLTAQDVGEAWLNYPPWGKGMYWWGGYGISAEHTAYENLRAGVPAPFSGSEALNGAELSGQIGGQIFSDAWGLVAPGEPELAAQLSEKAASVSHDGEAIWGGRFVAACIAAAFVEESIEAVVERGLAQIPASSTYTKVFRAVQEFYKINSGDWQACLAMLRRDYWRDKFGGGCHIIPNAGIMALALCYGQGSFDETLMICNRCGFDTDCNVGNLGAIMGVLVGLAGIGERWRGPINDFCACSSVVGALNLQDAASFALYLARAAVRLGHAELEQVLPETLPRLNFLLPGSTHACLWGAGEESKSTFGCWDAAHNGSLRLTLGEGLTRIWQRTYMRPDEFTDDRYTPSFCPTVYPGQTARARVCGGQGMRARLFAWDGNACEQISGEWAELRQGEAVELRWSIPAMDGACLMRLGVEWEAKQAGEAWLIALDWAGKPDFGMQFAKERHEHWSYGHRPVSQFVQLKGYWQLIEGALHGSCADLGEAYTGDPGWRDYEAGCALTPCYGGAHRLLIRVQGGARGYAVELSPDGLSLCKNADRWSRLLTVPFSWKPGEAVPLRVRVEGDRIRAYVGETCHLDYTDAEKPYRNGMVGLGVANGSRCRFDALSIRPIR